MVASDVGAYLWRRELEVVMQHSVTVSANAHLREDLVIYD